MRQFKVECGTQYYRIIGPNGEEGPRVAWDTTATIKIGEDLYYCDGDPDAEEQLVERVVTSEAQDGKGGRAGTTCEDVSFDDEEEEEESPAIGEEDEDEDDEEEEEETVGPQLV